jgi:proteasome lid subunit RPN8/RPN11
MSVKLTSALNARIRAHLERTHPNEGGGFLLGKQEGETVTISDAIDVENVFATEEQFHRYDMTPQNWAQMEDEADARGLLLVGYYHSHPDSPAIPSEFDRVHALPHFVYLITAVYHAQAREMFAWVLRDDRTQFNQVDLTLQ